MSISPPLPPAPAAARRRLSPALLMGLILVGLVLGSVILSFWWTPYPPLQVQPESRMQGPSFAHLFGTDKYGRDVLSAIIYGGRITLLVGMVAVGIAVVVGTPLGILAGMSGGWVDTVVMRSADVFLAFPALLLAIMFGAIFTPSTLSAMSAIGIATIPAFARVARAGTRQIMRTDYVLAARVSNQRAWRIAVRHVLPNISGIVLVQASVAFAIAVLAEAALSYLGLGTAPPTPSWGRMLQEAQLLISTHPHLVLAPGIAIALAVLGFNLLGDGLRDRFDSKLDRTRT